jgi:hypothetical protein
LKPSKSSKQSKPSKRNKTTDTPTNDTPTATELSNDSATNTSTATTTQHSQLGLTDILMQQCTQFMKQQHEQEQQTELIGNQLHFDIISIYTIVHFYILFGLAC